MSSFNDKVKLAGALVSNPQIIKAGIPMSLFLCNYMRKFNVRSYGDKLILHSHLPPLNSKAYTRFIDEHLLAKTVGPSHAQIGLTNLCPQKCEYCYNRDRNGIRMDTDTIIRLIDDLKKMGVLWIGFTGGEPLLNKDIVKITERVGDNCACKLFTTGCGLTKELASDLISAGLFSVSVSLDSWKEEEHDKVRGYKGAFKTALKAIEIFKGTGNIHVGVSAVLSKDMIEKGLVEEYLQFLSGLGIDEAWLSETKPSIAAFWDSKYVITEKERLGLVALQDKYNKSNKMTVNYLGHFEGREHFGCNAGHKMVYIDAFGEVSPCVFTPFGFGNIKDSSIESIWKEMRSHFPSENFCFMNKNYILLKKYSQGKLPMSKQDTLEMMKEVHFEPYSKFFQIYYGKAGTKA